MEIVVTGRHVEVADRFREHAQDKLEKVRQLDPKVLRLDVELSHERTRRRSRVCDRVEITSRTKGPVIRAEACADDPYAAFDLAYSKLMERLRRVHDKKTVHRRGRRAPRSVQEATAAAAPLLADEALGGHVAAPDSGTDHHPDAIEAEGDSPVVIREKSHGAVPMTLDQALYEMELVGHDFYLFVDAASMRPSVVYRRHGWDYGVIHLDVADLDAAGSNGSAATNGTSDHAVSTSSVADTRSGSDRVTV